MKKYLILVILFLSIFLACKESHKSSSQTQLPDTGLLAAPEWSKNANIYEVNIRQYTPEGTINAFSAHLDRLKAMGVDILWLMPIYPISEKNRKGSMGSYYAVQDYKKINPDFGTPDDFKNLIQKAHTHNMKVIIDWVPNHTGFDHIWINEHPEWYTKNEKGEITHPLGTDWTDVADLNYDVPEMRNAMTDAMTYWITEYDIDGFRCDVAGEVPNDFWIENNTRLFEKKPVFMLAEWDDPSLHDAGFHMTYGWGFHHVLNQIARGEITRQQIDSFILADQERYKDEDYRMNFITNHDENSWNGTIQERMSMAADAMAVIAFTIGGMPLIYSGQEAGLDWRLAFFEKDQIKWDTLKKQAFYTELLALKHKNKALWNGEYGGKYQKIQTTNDEHIFCFERKKDDDQIIVAVNISPEPQTFLSAKPIMAGEMIELFTQVSYQPSEWNKEAVNLLPWGFLVLHNSTE